jgi:BirA family biotin operon repressor/biotin-[acetyl-CoA-carboxylase] ligase
LDLSNRLLTPELVRRIIVEDETPLRCKTLPQDTVETIFRYGAIIGSTMEVHPLLTRGMDRARDLIRRAEQSGRSLASGTTIIAGEMTASRGRFQRPWHAPAGGLWLTVIVADTLLPENSRLYPLAAGAACCETLRYYQIPAFIKWVNDVHVRGRKIAGILTTTETGPVYGEEYVLIGVGINANNDSFPPELEKTATSMRTELGNSVDINRLAARLLAKLAWSIGLLQHEEQIRLGNRGMTTTDTQSSHPLLDLWQRLSDIQGRRVLFGYDVQTEPQYEAVIQGIDEQGSLLLKLADGRITVENSGEIIYLD